MKPSGARLLVEFNKENNPCSKTGVVFYMDPALRVIVTLKLTEPLDANCQRGLPAVIFMMQKNRSLFYQSPVLSHLF